MGIGLVLAFVASIAIFYLISRIVKKMVLLAVHAACGIFVFWLLKYFGMLSIPIDLVTVMIAAFGGIFGVILVIALSMAGIPL